MHPQALLLLILLLGTLGRMTSSSGSCSSIAGDVFRYPGGGRAVLDCSPRLANMPAAIFFSLTTDVSDILRCSRIYVEMPGFSRSEGGGDVVLEDTQRMSNKAKWNETTKKLEISVMDEVQKNVSISGRVPLSAGLRLPRAGLQTKTVHVDNNIDFAMPFAIGSFVPPEDQSEKITEILYSNAIDHSRPKIGIIIKFYNRMDIMPGESVTITLPFFGGASYPLDETADQNKVVSPAGSSFKSSWNSDTSKLTLHNRGSTVGPGFRTYTVEGNLRWPSNAMAQNDPRITIESNAIAGPVSPIAVVKSPQIAGIIASSNLSFCESKCDFNGFEWICNARRARPEHSAEIVLAFVLEVDLQIQETVTVELSGFNGTTRDKIPLSAQPLCDMIPEPGLKDSSFALENHTYGCASNQACTDLDYTGSGILNEASWSNSVGKLTLTASQVVRKGIRHVVVVPMDAGITLSSTGIRVNTVNFTLESSCVAGPLPRAPIQRVTAVGALEAVTLRFGTTQLATTTTVEFALTPMMDLEVDDVLKLTLLDLDNSHVSDSVVSNLSPHFLGTWSKSTSTLSLTCSLKAVAGSRITVTIPQSLGLRLPLEGVTPDSGKHFFTLRAAHGSISQSNIKATQRVGALLDTTRISYGASDGFGFSNLTFSCTTRDRLEAGHTISLGLAGFSGEASSGSPTDTVTSSTGDYVHSYTWQPGADSKLEVVLKADINADQRLEFVFHDTVRIALPVFGLAANSSTLTVSYLLDGTIKMQAISIETSPLVLPVLSRASLSFGAVRAGTVTSLHLELAPALALGFGSGDYVKVRLPGFTFKSSSRRSALSSAIISDAYFDVATLTGDVITFTVKDSSFTLSANQTMVVRLATSAGIILPEAGVRSGIQVLTIECNVKSAGKLYPTGIPSVQAVGALKESPAVSFGGSEPNSGTLPVAGGHTSIDLEFIPLWDLHPGDEVTLACEGFKGESRDRVPVTSTPPNAVRWATWDSSNGTYSGYGLLFFKIASRSPITAVTPIKVKFPTGIARLPKTGLSKCPSDMSLGSTCPMSFSLIGQKGTIAVEPRTWVKSYAPVGYLGNIALKFRPARPSALVEIDLTWVSEMGFGADVRATAYLEGFSVETTSSNGYTANGVAKTAVSGSSIFDKAEIMLSGNGNGLNIFLTAKAGAQGMAENIRIPSSAGIRSPMRGIPLEGNSILQMSLTSNDGGVSGTMINDVERVGAVVNSYFTLDPPSAGYLSQISIFLRPTMSVRPGEILEFHAPGFTGPEQITVSVVFKVMNSTGWALSSCIRQVHWDLATESFNATVSETIPANSQLNLIVGRDSKISVPVSGISFQEMPRAMYISTRAVSGRIDRQPLETKTFVPSILSTRYLEVFPKSAGSPASLVISLQARVKLNVGTTILLHMPGFTQGKECWDALPGDPLLQMRCLTSKRTGECGSEGKDNCSPDVNRYCLPFSPGINSFESKPKGGCRFKPKIYLGPHSQNRLMGCQEPGCQGAGIFGKQIGSCACLNGSEYEHAYASAFQQINMSTGYSLPERYGETCYPHDTKTILGEKVDGTTLHAGNEGPHLCSSFCFVRDNCPSAVAWHGYSTSYQMTPYSAYISYDTCSDEESAVQACEYKFPIEGRDGIADASWTLYDKYLVLTLSKPVVAFTPMTVYVPLEQKIVIPSHGLSQDLNDLKIDVVDGKSNARMKSISINIKDKIGSFFNATIDFLEYSAGMPVPITIAFTPLMNIQPGDTVSVVLKDFETDSNSIILTSIPANVRELASWNAATETLTMTAARNMPSSSAIQVLLPKPSGLKWKKVGTTKPGQGREVLNVKLSAALAQKDEFTVAEWEEFGMSDLHHNDYIKVSMSGQARAIHTYYQPVVRNAMRLPAQGLNENSKLFIMTDAKAAQVTVDLPQPLRSLRRLGALWNTAVLFDPSVYGAPLNVTFQFQPQMALVGGDLVILTMEGFTGPGTKNSGSLAVNTMTTEPPQTFDVLWSNNDPPRVPPSLIIRVKQQTKLPAKTSFKVLVPGYCAFLDEMLQCKQEQYIIRNGASAQAAHDPSKLYVSVRSKAGNLDNSVVRISSVLSEGRAMMALQGTWKGASYFSSGFADSANASHLMRCLSTAYQCPSKAAYRCETMRSDTELVVKAQVRQARITTLTGNLDFNIGLKTRSSNFGGDFQLLSMTGNELRLKNLTASEHLFDDDAANVIDTTGTTFCSYARAVYRVELNGTYDVALELYTDYLYRAVNPKPVNIRLRFDLTADSYFSPLGLELHFETVRTKVLEALSASWGLSSTESIDYSESKRCNIRTWRKLGF